MYFIGNWLAQEKLGFRMEFVRVTVPYSSRKQTTAVKYISIVMPCIEDSMEGITGIKKYSLMYFRFCLVFSFWALVP